MSTQRTEFTQLFDWGAKLRDTITGFEGRLVQITLHINGCTHYWLQPYGMDKDGKTFSLDYFDPQRLELVDETVKGIEGKGPKGGAEPKFIR